MTNTISVPRELLERIVGKCKLSVLGDDHAKVWELLAAPAVEGELEVAGYRRILRLNGQRLSDTYTFAGEAGQFSEGPYMEDVEPLCSLPKAQAIIEHLQETIASFEEGSERMAIKGIEMRLELDQQAARIAELEREICYLMGQLNGEKHE